MKKCSKCSKQIKDEAIKCCHCGQDIKKYNPGIFKDVKPEEHEQKKAFAYCKCGAGFLSPISKIGEKVKCPSCNNIFIMQRQFEIIKTDVGFFNNIAHCSCGGKIKYKKNSERKKAFCPDCKTYHSL